MRLRSADSRPGQRDSGLLEFRNLHIFHLLDSILSVCYIRQVFRCISMARGADTVEFKSLGMSD